MSTETAGYLVIFGIFAVLLGVIGYQTHLEDAVPALIFRGSFGALLIGCGILVAKGVRLSRRAALLTVALLNLGCLGRASMGWLTVAHGQAERVFASLLSTLLLLISGAVLWYLVNDRNLHGAKKPAGTRREAELSNE